MVPGILNKQIDSFISPLYRRRPCFSSFPTRNQQLSPKHLFIYSWKQWRQQQSYINRDMWFIWRPNHIPQITSQWLLLSTYLLLLCELNLVIWLSWRSSVYTEVNNSRWNENPFRSHLQSYCAPINNIYQKYKQICFFVFLYQNQSCFLPAK